MPLHTSSAELGRLMAICAENKRKTLAECIALHYEAHHIYLTQNREPVTSAFGEHGEEVELLRITE